MSGQALFWAPSYELAGMILCAAMFFAPFVILYGILLFLLLGVVFFLFAIGVIHYAFTMLGLPPQLAFFALLASLIGSYINIPLTRVESGRIHHERVVNSFGVRYRIPTRYAGGGTTTIAINFGGAIVPILISLYVLRAQPGAIAPAIIGIAIVSLVIHRFARPIPGLGIATPMFIPPIVAALTAWFLASLLTASHHIDAIAYVSGTLGTLIGADILNLRRIGDLGAPVASIGGAGTFDGVFLTGIVAVLLA
jgi:uncharacterized membrane protein